MSLLSQALEIAPGKNTRRDYSDEEVEVAIAWALGQVTGAQVLKAAELDVSDLLVILRYAVSKGKLVKA